MTLIYAADRTYVELEEAHECPVCHVARYYFVNESGSSKCMQCVNAAQQLDMPS